MTAAAGGTRARGALSTLAHAAAFTAAVLLGRASRLEGTAVAAVWPATAVAVVWLLTVWPHRTRRVIAGAAMVVLTVVVDVATGLPPHVAAVFSTASLLQAWVTCLVFRRRVPRGRRLTQRDDAWALTVAAVAGSLLGAAVIAVPFAVLRGTSPLVALATTVTGYTSMVVLAGLWLLLTDRGTRRADAAAGWPEVVAVNVGASTVFWWLFEVEHLYPLSFLVVAIGVWVGSRFQGRVAAANGLLVSAMHVLMALHGVGVFGPVPPLQRIVCVQLYVVVIAVLTLVLVLHRDERSELITSVRATQREAERQADLLRTVFESSSDGMSVYTAEGCLLMANSAALALYPTLPPGTPVSRFAEFVEIVDAAGDPVPGARLPVPRILAGEVVESEDLRTRSTIDGTTCIVNVTGRRLPRAEGASWSEGALIAFHDVTGDRAAAAEVARSRDLYAGILSGATQQLIIATELDGTVTVFNEGAQRMLGYRAADMLGRNVKRLHHLPEVEARAAALGVSPAQVFNRTLETTGVAATEQWTLVRADGEHRQVALTISWLLDAEGRRTGLLGVGTDVTDQVATQARLADSETRFRAAFDTAPVGMLIVGLGPHAGRILQVNTTMTEFTGLVPEELGILDVHAIAPAEDRDLLARHLGPLLAGHDADVQFEHRYLRADGSTGWGRTTASRVEAHGVEPYLLCLVEDVSARRQAEDALVHQAMHDTLTGLPNRALLRDRLAHALEAGQRQGTPVGVLLVDLDGFKAVNDSAGHAAGDDLLREVGRRLSVLSRAGDTVARLGGDEFAVVCPDTDADSLERLARRLLAAVREPVELPSGTFGVGASIGSALHPATGTDAGTLDRLLQNADLAMYAAKRAGKNRAYAYDDRDRERLERTERLLPELAEALARGEFEMHGQPIVDLGTGRVDAVETLLRWRRADGTVLTPGAFLDVLESSPLMPAVGEHVLRASAALAAQWERDLGPDAPAVHVNVSAEQLGGSLVDQVDRVLTDTGLSAGLLVLELTETHTTRITDALREELETLRGRGVRIAIDDLGTGYSGLARLTELPVDLLKIDLQFVAGLGRDPSCDAVVRAVLGIGQALGIQVVAEGVEDDEQARILASYGATLAQGYRFARPAPAAELLAALRRPALAG